MTYSPINSLSTYMPTVTFLGDEEDSKETVLMSILTDIINRLNSKEIGIYEAVEVLTGQRWFTAGSSAKRGVYRKVLLFPSLTAIGTTSVAHGLGNIAAYTFTRIYGTARNAAGTLHVALPQGGPDDVMITIGPANVNIICATATYNTFSALVVLEYLKN